ncbi:hypothetical protein HPB49_022895 [Dermacentor silvarum]|uniref:Uncharacterized protein n=1 Tax=Dermacentor silvarum TaxID=543639 RepID=A0ACB8E451_DERSI|nr:hypothetical protein HPB49_022895 [Dermacentor silvarum]
MLTGKEASFDLALVPKVELSDIKDYLVHARSFITHEQLKARKSLESHNYLTSGFVQEPQLRRHGEHIIVRTKDGMVKAAHCTCMAAVERSVGLSNMVRLQSRPGHSIDSPRSLPNDLDSAICEPCEEDLLP